MSEVQISLDELSSLAGKEIARLQRLAVVDAKAELQLRVWPFLQQLSAALFEDEEEEGSADVPVDLIAQTVGLLVGLVQHIGQPIAPEDARAVAARAAEISEALVALVDADELADYLAVESAARYAPAAAIPAEAAVLLVVPEAKQTAIGPAPAIIDVTPSEPNREETSNG